MNAENAGKLCYFDLLILKALLSEDAGLPQKFLIPLVEKSFKFYGFNYLRNIHSENYFWQRLTFLRQQGLIKVIRTHGNIYSISIKQKQNVLLLVSGFFGLIETEVKP